MTGAVRRPTRGDADRAVPAGDVGGAAPAGNAGGATSAGTRCAPFDTPPQVAQAASLRAQFDALPRAWRDVLGDFMKSDACARLCDFVDGERASGKTIYPAEVFRALHLTPPSGIKIVVLGQDPYHGEDHGVPQAHGLAFSVPAGMRPPPSLRNIFKEVSANFGDAPPVHGCLDSWARQGVLLLNTVLTVARGNAGSHAKRGWEACTDVLVRFLGASEQPLIFMLWGAHAQAKRPLLAGGSHLVLEAPHPSPLSAHRGFLGCRHFVLANERLTALGQTPIDWHLPAR